VKAIPLAVTQYSLILLKTKHIYIEILQNLSRSIVYP